MANAEQRDSGRPEAGNLTKPATRRGSRWLLEDCGQLVATYNSDEEANAARDAHLARYRDWDRDQAEVAVDAVTVHRDAGPDR